MLVIGLGTWRSRFICRLNMLFVCKIIVPFPLSIGQILGNFFYNKLHLFSYSVNPQCEGVVQGKGPWRKKLWPPSEHTIWTPLLPNCPWTSPTLAKIMYKAHKKLWASWISRCVEKNVGSTDCSATTVVFWLRQLFLYEFISEAVIRFTFPVGPPLWEVLMIEC